MDQGRLEELLNAREPERIATGLPSLDSQLEGGLGPWLYCIGGLPGTGKTTLALQIADQIAQSGRDVLFFTLEMPAAELVRKSIRRLEQLNRLGATEEMHTRNAEMMAEYNARVHEYHKALAAARRAMCEKLGKRTLTRIEREELEKSVQAPDGYVGYNINPRFDFRPYAIQAYRELAPHISFYEVTRDGLFSYSDVKSKIDEAKKTSAASPVVFIDYLQVYASDNAMDGPSMDKQDVDRAIYALKRISAFYETPIVAISSFNRLNYYNPAEYRSFKESGGIEYTSDVLLGLQLLSRSTKEEGFMHEMSRPIRDMELTIIKNRHGSPGATIALSYDSANDIFSEIGAVAIR